MVSNMASQWMAVCSTAGIIASLLNGSAQALTLQGHANVSTATESIPSTYPAPVALQAQTGQSVPGQTLSLGVHAAQPTEYQGVWRCVSLVTRSSVPNITLGRQMECLISFKVNIDGKLMVYWDQSGWTSSNCSVVNFSPIASSIAHKSSCSGNSNWTALSRDRLRLITTSQMEGQSQVVQYQFGQMIGTYETNSILTRVQ